MLWTYIICINICIIHSWKYISPHSFLMCLSLIRACSWSVIIVKSVCYHVIFVNTWYWWIVDTRLWMQDSSIQTTIWDYFKNIQNQFEYCRCTLPWHYCVIVPIVQSELIIKLLITETIVEWHSYRCLMWMKPLVHSLSLTTTKSVILITSGSHSQKIPSNHNYLKFKKKKQMRIATLIFGYVVCFVKAFLIL